MEVVYYGVLSRYFCPVDRFSYVYHFENNEAYDEWLSSRGSYKIAIKFLNDKEFVYDSFGVLPNGITFPISINKHSQQYQALKYEIENEHLKCNN